MCGIYGQLFGGYEKFGSTIQVYKKYEWTNTAHHSLKASMTIIKIDSWDDGYLTTDYLYIYLDETKQESLWSSNDAGPSHQCGGKVNVKGTTAYNEDKLEKIYTISHSTSTITLKFQGSFNDNVSDESWGVRDISLTLQMCDTTCSS